MMKRIVLCLLLLLPPAGSLLCQEAGIRFTKANELYRGGKYAEAIHAYEEIVSNGYESPALYYNLGNAYYKAGEYPAAILNYERARRLSPDDEDILHNLRLANLRIIDKIEPVPRLFFLEWWESFIGSESASGWGNIAIVTLWVSVMLLAGYRLSRGPAAQRAFLLSGAAAVAISVFAFMAGGIQAGRESSGGAAILFTPSVSVKSAPDSQSTDIFVIHEGVKVDLLDSVGEWRKIRLADGKIGWLPMSDLKVI
jgi:tetratricopeptide (TPR) repeat protein